MESTLWVNLQWSDNTIGIKESEHSPFSLVHEKGVLDLAHGTHSSPMLQQVALSSLGKAP